VDREVFQMNKRNLKKIYEFLERNLLELEEPCENCRYFECEKNSLNKAGIIKEKYRWNDIDWKSCLKKKRKRLDELMLVLRLPEFKEWSYEKCIICGKSYFKFNMKLHSEIAKKSSLVLGRKGYEYEF